MQILWLDEAACQDEAAVGGKAATLARLAAYFRVPPGFCVTTEAFAVWQASGQAALSREDMDALEAAYGQLAIRSGQARPAVAVRSSAVGEDGQEASFAGQFETKLGVVGAVAVSAALVRCWRSAQSEQAQIYRRQQGQPNEGQGMGVLVQQMVQADAAAVAFSANPVNGRRDEVVIEVVRGLGTSLVGGTATPDRYLLRKQEQLQIVERSLSDEPVLCGEQVMAIARLAVDLETHESKPVDLECAYQDGTLYLLQCRPITTLEAIVDKVAAPNHDVGELPEVVWDRPEDAQRTWSGGSVMLPLQQSLALQYYQGWAKAFRRVKVIGGLRARNYCGREYRCWDYNDTLPWPEADAERWALEQQVPRLWAEEWLPRLQKDLTEWAAVDIAQLPNDELARHLQEMLAKQTHHWEIHAVMGSTPLSAVQRLIDWYLERFAEAPESEPYRLLQGQGNTSIESNHLLWNVSKKLAPDELATLQGDIWEDLSPTLQATLETFTSRVGGERNKVRQRAMQLAVHYARPDVADPLATVVQLAADREHFTIEVRNRLTLDEQAHFDEMLRCALANHPLTEDHNYWLDNLSDRATQRVTAELAQRLLQANSLSQVEEADYLTVHEMILWGYGLADPLRPRVAARSADYQRYAKLPVPDYLGQPPQPAPWTDRFGGPAVPLEGATDEIRGVGASAGRVVARARVVATLDDALFLQPGEVLVCPATDPSWTPLFALAAALVTDSGGSLSHAAVVAREYRLPAVTGTHLATKRIRSGQLVEVDGTKGIVKLLLNQ